jgi:adenylate kinase family enzyme
VHDEAASRGGLFRLWEDDVPEFPPLENFGNRIMICGPSNAGKSTLAAALGRKLGAPPVHLDQLYHVPGSDWVPRPREEFVALHNEAITGESWVMDGNYSGLTPARVGRATGAILVRSNRWSNLVRYFRRTLFERGRAGSLEGSRDSIKWHMIRWIVFAAPPKMRTYRQMLSASGLPYLEVNGMSALKRLYAEWNLDR